MEMLQMLFEGTEKSTLIEECHMVVLSLLLTANSDRQEHFTKHHRMLAAYILYIMYKWNTRAFKLVKYNLPSIPDALQLIQASPSFCTLYITRRAFRLQQ
jgi:hypothetical protein